MNEGFGKNCYRKGNLLKRSGPVIEPPDSELKNSCPRPLPENQLLSFETLSLRLEDLAFSPKKQEKEGQGFSLTVRPAHF